MKSLILLSLILTPLLHAQDIKRTLAAEDTPKAVYDMLLGISMMEIDTSDLGNKFTVQFYSYDGKNRKKLGYLVSVELKDGEPLKVGYFRKHGEFGRIVNFSSSTSMNTVKEQDYVPAIASHEDTQLKSSSGMEKPDYVGKEETIIHQERYYNDKKEQVGSWILTAEFKKS